MDVKTFGTIGAIGKSVIVPGLDLVIAEIKQAWTTLKTTVKVNRTQIVQFMVASLDTLIVYLVQHDIPGEDKKATVMQSMNSIYDWVVAQAMPIWLMPFKSKIKDFIMNVVVSHAIDWVVSKYNDGSWSIAKQSVSMQMFGVPEGHRPE